MAKKELAPDEPTPSKKENLFPVKAVSGFLDGNLAEYFAELGYPVEWPAGEVRNLTLNLYNRCKQSGAELELLAK